MLKHAHVFRRHDRNKYDVEYKIMKCPIFSGNNIDIHPVYSHVLGLHVFPSFLAYELTILTTFTMATVGAKVSNQFALCFPSNQNTIVISGKICMGEKSYYFKIVKNQGKIYFEYCTGNFAFNT